MSWIRFADELALQVALTSEAIAPKLAQRGLQLARDGRQLWIKPKGRVARSALQALSEAGYPSESEPPAGSEPSELSCWGEALTPERVGEDERAPERGQVLFLLPPEVALADLATELLRLGCDRLQAASAPQPDGSSLTLARVIDPPYYTLVRAIDRERGVRAFAPTPAGQGGVWTEVGWCHPLVDKLAGDDGLLLIEREGRWLRLPALEWQDLYTLAQLLPPAVGETGPGEELPRFEVPLRLVGSPDSRQPQLWILTEDAVEQVDLLAETLPQSVLDRLLFAVGERAGQPPLIALKARPSAAGPPALVLRGETYAPLRQLPQLHLPCRMMLDPPLRQESLVSLLSPDARYLTWLSPAAAAEGARTSRRVPFALERLPESAFRPLSSWVDYLVDQDREALDAWFAQTRFAFEPFVRAELTPADGRAPQGAKPTPAPARPSRRPTRAAAVEPEEQAPAAPAPVAPRIVEVERREPSALERALDEAEQSFLALESPGDAPERSALWLEMARLHYALENRREGAQCWARYLWELPPEEAEAGLLTWASEESQGSDPAELAGALLAEQEAGRNSIQTLAALVIGGAADGAPEAFAAALREALHELQLWFDQRDEVLDVRTLWLLRWALARLSGGDSLSLARARDRVLRHLHQGLSPQRDLPQFLRFLGRSDRSSIRTTAAVEQLTRLRQYVQETPREGSELSAGSPQLTLAYTDFLFAYALARLGESDQAAALRDGAAAQLDTSDPVHALLVDSYRARIEHALEGLPPATPLPAELISRRDGMPGYESYIVNRLRQWSTILEPSERLNPYDIYVQHGRDPDELDRRIDALRAQNDPGALDQQASALFELLSAGADNLPPGARWMERGLGALYEQAPRLTEVRATQILERSPALLGAVEGGPRALLLEQALRLAGHFGHQHLVREFVGMLTAELQNLGGEQLTELGPVLSVGLETLRRLGLDELGAGLLETCAEVTNNAGDSAALLLTRVRMAESLAYLDRVPQALAICDEAAEAVVPDRGLAPDRLRLARALARALRRVPEEDAEPRLAQLAEQLPTINDQYNTNSHFCLSAVHFVESLIMGYLDEDLALGELGKRWLDEDEFLVRRRIHRDFQQATGS